jgi:hypothetical protein
MGVFPPDHKALADALALGWQALSRRDDADVARSAGVESADGVLRLSFLNDALIADPRRREVLVRQGDSAAAAPTGIAVLALHYLGTADGSPETGKLAGFAELPGGAGYLRPFNGRVVDRLARKFGNTPTAFLKCGMDLGGRKTGLGDGCGASGTTSWRSHDNAMVFPVFPRVPVTVALWRGDEELPPGASVSFDRSVTHYLSTEDVVVACEELVGRLSRVKQALGL